MTQLQQLFDSCPILFSQYPHAIPLSYLGIFRSKFRMKTSGFNWAEAPWPQPALSPSFSSPVYLLSTSPPGGSWMQGSVRDPGTQPHDPLLHCHLITSDTNLFSVHFPDWDCPPTPTPRILAWSCPLLEADRTVGKVLPTMSPRAVSPSNFSLYI